MKTDIGDIESAEIWMRMDIAQVDKRGTEFVN
jgi:hypothetical protein